MMEVMVLMMRLYTFRLEYGINRFISNSLMHLMDSRLWVRASGAKRPERVRVVVDQLEERFDHRGIQHLRQIVVRDQQQDDLQG